ncbi:MAG: hypothetical protein WDM71_06100 [Ferruginibacter sp.]
MPASIPSGSTLNDSAAITGLSSNTVYHYNDSATNAIGHGAGLDHSFTTVSDAPTVATGTPGTGSVSASWSAHLVRVQLLLIRWN